MSDRILIVVFAAAFIAALFAYAHPTDAQVISDGLVAYWPMDGVSGGTVADVVGGFDGTVTDGSLPVVAGAIGSALEFDGSAYIDTGEEVAELGAADFSITFWLKTGEVGIAVLSKGGGAGWDPNEKEVYVADAASSEGSNTGPVEIVGWGVDWIRGSEPVNDNEWHHVAITWDIDAMEGHVYTDGVEGTDYLGYNGGADNAGDIVRIGFHESGHSATNFIGKLDDLRIYQRTVTEAEVGQIMAEDPSAVKPADKLAITWGMIK